MVGNESVKICNKKILDNFYRVFNILFFLNSVIKSSGEEKRYIVISKHYIFMRVTMSQYMKN